MEPTGIIGTSSGSASLDDAPQTAPSPRLRGAQVEKPWLARPGLFFGHVLLLFQGPVRFGEVGFGRRALLQFYNPHAVGRPNVNGSWLTALQPHPHRRIGATRLRAAQWSLCISDDYKLDYDAAGYPGIA